MCHPVSQKRLVDDLTQTTHPERSHAREAKMKRGSGTYAVVLESPERTEVQVGRWRTLQIQPGYYIYIGSAFGPGGLRARLSRHFREQKNNHWHIDYLREAACPIGAWVCHDPEQFEHLWATQLGTLEGFVAINGFGCTDCACQSHLFFTTDKNAVANFWHKLSGKVEQWSDSAA